MEYNFATLKYRQHKVWVPECDSHFIKAATTLEKSIPLLDKQRAAMAADDYIFGCPAPDDAYASLVMLSSIAATSAELQLSHTLYPNGLKVQCGEVVMSSHGGGPSSYTSLGSPNRKSSQASHMSFALNCVRHNQSPLSEQLKEVETRITNAQNGYSVEASEEHTGRINDLLAYSTHILNEHSSKNLEDLSLTKQVVKKDDNVIKLANMSRKNSSDSDHHDQVIQCVDVQWMI